MTVQPHAPTAPALPDPSQIILDGKSKQPSLINHLLQLNTAILKETSKTIKQTQPVEVVLLRSPRGNIYSLGVSDTGTISATLMYQPP